MPYPPINTEFFSTPHYSEFWRLYTPPSLHFKLWIKSDIITNNIRKMFEKLVVKACVCYILSNFYFSPNDSPSKTMKCFLFHRKSSFRSWDIQNFVYSSSPLFFPVSHCCTGWLKKNEVLWRHHLSK